MTKQRELVFDIVTNSKDHLTAEQIFFEAKKLLPSVVLATIYNNLNYLTENEYIRKLTVSGEPDRYDQNKYPHDHMICIKCGKITDFIIRDLKSDIESATGVKINRYELNAYYLCDNCKKS